MKIGKRNTDTGRRKRLREIARTDEKKEGGKDNEKKGVRNEEQKQE